MSSDYNKTVAAITHAPLEKVTPEMLAWWYTHIPGTMEYAGETLPRYLVWHPLDHISYDVSGNGVVGPGSRLHLKEALGRDPEMLVDLRVTVESFDNHAAIITKRMLSTSIVRLENEFTSANGGAQYTTRLTVGDTTPLATMFLNRVAHTRACPAPKLTAWIRHHVEEIGNLDNFLPDLYRDQADNEP